MSLHADEQGLRGLAQVVQRVRRLLCHRMVSYLFVLLTALHKFKGQTLEKGGPSGRNLDFSMALHPDCSIAFKGPESNTCAGDHCLDGLSLVTRWTGISKSKL